MQKNIINWLNNTPYSIEFNDIYFSKDDGIAETEHVFVAGNQLTSRFTSAPHFYLAETGFGTGLNFFVVADLWQKIAPKEAKLHFFSVEKSPLNLAEMQQACGLWPSFSNLHSQFLQHYASLNSGRNVWQITPQITLELWICDVLAALPQLNLPVDAWLLDGFAPAKNADMWSPAVFAHMARTALPDNTTFATFTSAGFVRRGLQAAGFQANKYAGFGKKREMLAGIFKGAA